MTTTYTQRVVVVVMIPLLALSFLLPPQTVQAQTQTTNAQLLAQVQALLTQVLALQQQLAAQTGAPAARPGNVPANYTFTRTLSVGMSGEDVLMLQRVLNSDSATRVAQVGPGSPGNETQFFGPMTRDAVSRFQTRHRSEILAPLGLLNPTGMVGPSTRAKLNQLTRTVATTPTTPTTPPTTTTPTSPSTPTTPVLAGGEGSIDVSEQGSSQVTMALGEQEEVYAVDVEAIDSDVAINRVDFHFNERPWLYFETLTLKADGRSIGTIAAQSSNFARVGNQYRARFANINEVVREGEQVEMTLELKTRSALAGNRVNDTITVQIPDRGIRMLDGAGLTGHGPEGAALRAVTISFDDTFGRADLTVRAAQSTPDKQNLEVRTSARTTVNNVLSFDVTAPDQAVTLDEIDIVLKTNVDQVQQVVHRVQLFAGTTLIGTQNVSFGSGERVVTFSRLDRRIARGSTTSFRVQVEIEQASRFTVPNTLEVVLREVRGEASDSTRVNRSSLQIGAGTVHNLVVAGMAASDVGVTATAQANDRVGVFRFVFDLTAFGNTFYLSENGLESVVADVTSGTATVSGISVSSNARLTSNGNYRLVEGQTRRFTIDVVLDNATQNGFHRVTLEELVVGSSDEVGTPSGSTIRLGGSEFRSPTLFLISSS